MYQNRDLKLKLIFPCMFEDWGQSFSGFKNLPYGMGVLVAILRQNNYYVEQEDLSIKFNWHRNYFFSSLNLNEHIYISEYRKEIFRIHRSGDFKCKLGLIIDELLDSFSLSGFDLIGFSITTYNHFIFASLLSKRIKQNINKCIVFGGPFITLYGHLYPWVFNWVDYMIVGDGGFPLLRLIDYINNKIPLSEVPNLIYKEKGQLKTNPKKRYPIEEITAPDFDGLTLDLYKNYRMKGNIVFPYQITRGCTNRCAFCVNTRINEKLEFKSCGKVLAELKQIQKKYNCSVFYFCDDAINNSYEYLEGLCDLFIENRLNIHWITYAKVGNLDTHILRRMRKAGCQGLSFGIESGSNDIIKRMNKGFTAEEASQTLKDTTKARIQNHIFLITGFPHETEEDIKKTIDFIKKNKRYISFIYRKNFILDYGSPIHLDPERYGITKMLQMPSSYRFAFDESSRLTWKQKQKQQHSREEIRKAVNKYIKYRNIVFYCYRLFCLIIFGLYLRLKKIKMPIILRKT